MRFLIAGLAAMVLATTSYGGEVRTWTARDGKQMEGEFVRREGADVYLARDGKEHKVPLARLSAEDQQYIERQSAAKQDDPDDPFSQSPGASSGNAGKEIKKKEPPKKYELRTWRDAQGQTVSAKFLRVAGNNVVLERPGGRLLSVPETTLSLDDRNYVREQLGLPALPPPTEQNARNNAIVANGAGNPVGNAAMPPRGNGPGSAPAGTVGQPLMSHEEFMAQAKARFDAAGGVAVGGNRTAPPPSATTTSPFGGSITPPAPPPTVATSPPASTLTAPPGNAGNFNAPITTATPQPIYTPPVQTALPSSPPPQFSMPQSPTFPIASAPAMPSFQERFQCSRCRRDFTMNEVQGKARCPGCGCIWNNAGQVTGATAYEQGRAVGFVAGPILIISVIVALVRKFSTN